MNSTALWSVISSGRYPRIAVELGLTCTNDPLVSVTRIRSCEVSKMRWRSSISWLSAAWVFLLSVMSRAILEAPMISPEIERSGEIEIETSSSFPSLVLRWVSW
jgi:hypothetical protein